VQLKLNTWLLAAAVEAVTLTVVAVALVATGQLQVSQ
jgi:hypothetical protein